VPNSKKQRLDPKRLYVADQPSDGIVGTPLCVDDLCDDGTNAPITEHVPASCYVDPYDSDQDLEDHVVFVAEGCAGLSEREDESGHYENDQCSGSEISGSDDTNSSSGSDDESREAYTADCSGSRSNYSDDELGEHMEGLHGAYICGCIE